MQMEKGTDYEACLGILERESGLLEELAPVQEAVTQAVLKREWEGFDASLGALEDLSGRFEALEAERVRVFGEDARFYTLASRFPPGKRGELGRRYRELKQRSLMIRLANASLLEYLNEARAVVGSFFENALPSRSGPAYSRQGARLSQDMRSMVVNQSF